MTGPTLKAVVLAETLVVLGLAALVAFATAAAQPVEREPPTAIAPPARPRIVAPNPTRTWQVAELPTVDAGALYKPARVDVVDTAGVCLYVARGLWTSSADVALAVVPKTALPPGAGCQ